MLYKHFSHLSLIMILFLFLSGFAIKEKSIETEKFTEPVFYTEKHFYPKNPSGTVYDFTVSNAAHAAMLLRNGIECDAYRYWESALPHVPEQFKLKKVTIGMLKHAVGSGNESLGIVGIRFQACPEVPLPEEGEILEKDMDCNLHGTVYSDSPILSVTASMTSLENPKHHETKSVQFSSDRKIYAYSLSSKTLSEGGISLDQLFDPTRLPAGDYKLVLSVATELQPTDYDFYSKNVKIVPVRKHTLHQNQFDDNYSTALRYTEGNSEELLFSFLPGDDRNILPENSWSRKFIHGKSGFGKVATRAAEAFNNAFDFLNQTWFRVDLVQTMKNGEVQIREGKTLKLKTLVSKSYAYVPRFQSGGSYISHHSFGTAIDINDNLTVNRNQIWNHEVIGEDVQNHLTYQGIRISEKGIPYYSFIYDGTCTDMLKRVPHTIVNYLLYELAFYRAGFSWGFYYETACDAMHFMLTEKDPKLHMDSDIGLRKVFVYVEDLSEYEIQNLMK